MKNLGLLLALALVIASCKKEVKIEKNLWKGDGKWNIEKYHSKETSSDNSSNFEETLVNAGSYTFKKDGTGVMHYSYNGDEDFENFTYTNTTDILTLTIDSEPINYKMDWSKNEMTISVTNNYSMNNVSYTYTETILLKKQ